MGSVTKEEKDRLKAIIADTVTLLCKNGLNAKFKREFVVEGLIGITLDNNDLLLIPIKEIIENPNPPPPTSSSDSGGDSSGEEQKADGSGRKRKRNRKKRPADTPGKTNDDSDNEPDFDGSETGTDGATPAKRSLFSQQTSGATGGGNMDSNDSYFTLHDIKQDHSDDDLIEIIKEEPGLRSPHGHQPPHIVSIQSLPGPPRQMGHMGAGSPGQMGSGPPLGHMGPGDQPPGLQMAPGQYEDLMQQVELIPGSGVYIKKATFNQLQFIDKGSKLVRKLVREIFPDVHLLASSSCMGKGETSAGLDRHKVEVIKGYVHSATSLSMASIVHCINQICKEARYRLQGGKSGGHLSPGGAASAPEAARQVPSADILMPQEPVSESPGTVWTNQITASSFTEVDVPSNSHVTLETSKLSGCMVLPLVPMTTVSNAEVLPMPVTVPICVPPSAHVQTPTSCVAVTSQTN